MPFVGELSALLTACLWSCGAFAFASATQQVSSFQVNITRLILAAVYLVVLIALMGFDTHLSRTQILNLSISGVIGLSLGDTFLFKAFQEIGARVSMLIMSLAPAIAAVFAYFFLHETISMIGMIGMSITVFGVGIVVFDRGPAASEKLVLTRSGLTYAVLAAVGQGLGLIFAKMAFQENELDGFVATEVRIVASLVLLLPFGILTRRYYSPVRMFRETSRAFWLTALGSILGPFLGISFSLIAVKHTKVGIAATIMALVPIMMLPLGKLIHKEKLSWQAIIGAFLAVSGVAVLLLISRS